MDVLFVILVSWLWKLVWMSYIDDVERDVLFRKAECFLHIFYGVFVWIYSAPDGSKSNVRCCKKDVLCGCATVLDPEIGKRRWQCMG